MDEQVEQASMSPLSPLLQFPHVLVEWKWVYIDGRLLAKICQDSFVIAPGLTSLHVREGRGQGHSNQDKGTKREGGGGGREGRE